MPSPIGHTIGAYAVVMAMEPSFASNREKHSLALGIAFVLGTLADADFIVAHLSTHPVLRHHFFSHSIPFAILLTGFCFVLLRLLRVRRPGRNALMLGAAYTSHLILDYLAHDGSKPFGIPLLWPVTSRHFIAPSEVFYSIHRGDMEDLFSLHNLAAIGIEAGVLLPFAALAFLHARRFQRRDAQDKDGKDSAFSPPPQ